MSGRTRPLLAVYGSLMRSAGQQVEALGLAASMRYLGPCRWRGVLLDLGDWPGFVDGDGVVHGELWQLVDAQAFAVLDDYEDCAPPPPTPPQYVRECRRLIDPAVDAWIYRYLHPQPTLRRIADGRWHGPAA